mmetsp:Transcript_20587/g.32811  ORF Transcript_20587/g.32811 Transcript_20587/m.32811 type:complete len:80 (-) Transcript_20587:725-964(-)
MLSEFDTQNLSNMAWSVAMLGIANYPLLDAIAPEALRKMPHYHPQELANTAWALDALSYQHAPLMQAISSAAMNSLPRM